MYVVKAYRWSKRIAPFILNLGTRWKSVVSFTLRSLESQRSSQQYPFSWCWVDPTALVYICFVEIVSYRLIIMFLCYVFCYCYNKSYIILTNYMLASQHSSTSRYWLDGPDFELRWGTIFFGTRLFRLPTHPASCIMENGPLSTG
jgi:hypothetical protein